VESVHQLSLAENTSTGISEPTPKKSHSSVRRAERSSQERKHLPLFASFKVLTLEVMFFDATSSRMQFLKIEGERIQNPGLPSEHVLLVLVAESVARVVRAVMAARKRVLTVNTLPRLSYISPYRHSRAEPLRQTDRTIRLVAVRRPKRPLVIL